MKTVTKQEYEDVITQYPRPLKRDVVGFAEPPVMQYNDFSLGPWPKSVVAQRTIEPEPTYRIVGEDADGKT